MDSEDFRGLPLVPVGQLEGLQDGEPLHLFQRAAGRHGHLPAVRTGAWRKVAGRSPASMRVPRRQDHGPLDDVLQLAHVARPGVLVEHLQRVVGEPLHRPAVGVGEASEEARGEQGDVAGPLAQRRNLQRDGVQPEVEILAQASVGDGLRHVDVGGADEAEVRLAPAWCCRPA